MYSTWYGCSSLTIAVVPVTTNWRPTSIGNYFMGGGTWLNCTSLTTALVPDTSNWTPTSIGTNFMNGTWNGCTALTTAFVPDTTNWNVSSVGNNFMLNTFINAFSSLSVTRTVEIRGDLYVSFNLSSNAMGIDNVRITNIKVDIGLIPTYQSNTNWITITPSSKFISW
jgi:hypothetical protein